MILPQHLAPWDTVAVVSSSRGGPWAVPARYEIWVQQLESEFGLHVKAMPHALADPQRVYEHPELRAQDLMDAFRDPNIKWIISSIGGDDSIRMLPYIDLEVIRTNPKIYLGYSDSTITHFLCQKAWLVSFYGPSILAWFAENAGMFPYMVTSVQKSLFDPSPIGLLQENIFWRTSERLEWWNPANQSIPRTLQASTPWRYLQWSWVLEWQLLGGCLDVFPFIIGTSIRPSLEEWKDKILFFETSEEQISTAWFEYFLRNLWSQGILSVISWILQWRPQRNDETWVQLNYDESLLKIVVWEFGRLDIPIVTNMDFGHTAPQMILPLWVKARIDVDRKQISIIEPATR